ncbi:MAG: CDP-glycerol glycerophosphotransferase family protein [Jatrophihabitans sp.]
MIGRRLRRIGGNVIRRWGLLPEGDPDGLGDDETLRGQSLAFTVMLYFPDTAPNIYQLRQWYRPLMDLNARHLVGIVCLDSRTASAVRAECPLPVVCCGRIATLEDLVSRSDVALALYVNHNVRNLHPLRFPTMLHAYLGHGESDKAASASNQVKAYDFALVAADAGRDRLRRNLLRYDTEAHVRTIGRPQLDGNDTPAVDGRREGDRLRVLYAPTWEGAQPSMAYSSVVTHGEAILRSLLATQQFDVVYRPHPRTGANSAGYAAADRRLRELITEHAPAGRSDASRVDLAPTWDARHDAADLLISDISAVAADWMTTGKPLLVTVPASPGAFIDTDTVLTAAPGITVTDAPRTAELVLAEIGGGDAAKRRAWVQYAMGDTSPGASSKKFLHVCDELVALRGREMSARTARMGGEQT